MCTGYNSIPAGGVDEIHDCWRHPDISVTGDPDFGIENHLMPRTPTDQAR